MLQVVAVSPVCKFVEGSAGTEVVSGGAGAISAREVCISSIILPINSVLFPPYFFFLLFRYFFKSSLSNLVVSWLTLLRTVSIVALFH